MGNDAKKSNLQTIRTDCIFQEKFWVARVVEFYGGTMDNNA
jgi:hypothetical protein